jgi:hypothetical protein
MKKYFVFISINLIWVLSACLTPAETSEHPCELAANCIYDPAAGSSDCAQGYTWENPGDLDNYNCVLSDICTPTSCEVQGYNCGDIPDDCDTILNCGTCPAGQTCGAGGPNICGEGSCTPTTCAAQGANCGSISDGCGGLLECGTCPSGQTCGGGGVSNVCGSQNTDPPSGLDNAHLLQSKLSLVGWENSGSDHHYCNISTNNDVKCWGANYDEQASTQSENGNWVGTSRSCNLGALGQVRCLTTYSYSSSMIDLNVPDLKQLSASRNRPIVGVTTEGTLVVWDIYSDAAQEGSDPIPTGNDFVSTAINQFIACGLREEGSLACWKYQSSYTDEFNLLAVPTDHTFKQVTLGMYHGCALTTEDKIVCWGVNDGASSVDDGQVNDAPTDDGYIALASNIDDRSCALKSNGQVRCWGNWYNGAETVFTIDNPNKATLTMTENEVCARAEDSTMTCKISKILQFMETTHLDVALSLESICTITSAGDAICQGKLAEDDGYITDWNQINTSGPYSKIATWRPYANIANNPNLLCTLGQNGRLRCWGGGGQSSRISALYNDVNSLTATVFSDIAVGVNFGCGLNNSGQIVCFGDNNDYDDNPSGSGYTSFDVGEIYSAAIDANGQMQCWGGSGYCAASGMTFTKVSVDKSGQYSYPNTWAIDTDGQLHEWDFFSYEVTLEGTYKEVAAGGNVACAISTAGSLECWGMDQDPPAGSNFVKVVADTDQACALTTEDKVTCWGNTYIPLVD